MAIHEDIVSIIKTGSLSLVKDLLGKIISPDLKQRVLQLASLYGRLDVINYIVQQGVTPGELIDPLVYSAEKGYLDVVKYLVEHGANIYAQNNRVLLKAAEHGHLDIVKYLVSIGMNLHDPNNKKALLYAAGNGHLDVVKYLVEQGVTDSSALEPAVKYNYFHVVKYLIEQGANPNINNGGPLNLAAEYNYPQIFEYLIQNGAVVNNTTALYAVIGGNLEIVKYIVQHYYINNETLNNLISLASNENRLDIVNYLSKKI